uniref:Uncharacterized protein n=2 Tax=Vibrio TaxID=662 RepID=A0A0H4A1K2_9VIBR|nr:hypothetical protein [Vibrio genomosp. F6]AKN39626.1 hypothetical protein [Vibrio tasmaniensis]
MWTSFKVSYLRFRSAHQKPLLLSTSYLLILPLIYNRSAQSRSWRSQSKGEQAEYRKYFSMALSL